MNEILDYSQFSVNEITTKIGKLPSEGKHHRITSSIKFAESLAKLGVAHVLVSEDYLQQFEGGSFGFNDANEE